MDYHAIEAEYVREREAELEPEEIEDRKAEQLEKNLRYYIKGDPMNMKKIIIVIALIALSSCAKKSEYSHYDEKLMQDRPYWDEIVPSAKSPSGLWRYVDSEYGIIIYIGHNGRMTSQKIGKGDL